MNSTSEILWSYSGTLHCTNNTIMSYHMIYVGGEMISAGELSLLSSPFHKIKFEFSKKATKIDENLTVDLTLTT